MKKLSFYSFQAVLLIFVYYTRLCNATTKLLNKISDTLIFTLNVKINVSLILKVVQATGIFILNHACVEFKNSNNLYHKQENEHFHFLTWQITTCLCK